MSEVHPIVAGLLDEDVDQETLLEILTDEQDAKPHVLALLVDRNLWWSDSPGGGRAPTRALFLVGKLGWVDAVPAVLDALADTDPDDELYAAALDTLKELGEDAIPAVLDAAEADPALRAACAEVLAESGARDPRILRLLERVLEEDPELGAGFLVDYGDPDALTALHRAFARAAHPNDKAAAVLVRELAWAIRELGGSLVGAEEAKAYRARAWLGERQRRLEG